MAQHLKTGSAGEKMAIEYLKYLGYQIRETNWKFSRAEIDIIAKDGDILVFIEVKTRTNIEYGRPEEFVRKKKTNLILDASQRYMESIEYDWEIRFDIVSVIFHPKDWNCEIQLFKDAFY